MDKSFDRMRNFCFLIKAITQFLEQICNDRKYALDEVYGYHNLMSGFVSNIENLEPDVKHKNFIEFAKTEKELLKVFYLGVSTQIMEVFNKFYLLNRPKSLNLLVKSRPNLARRCLQLASMTSLPNIEEANKPEGYETQDEDETDKIGNEPPLYTVPDTP